MDYTDFSKNVLIWYSLNKRDLPWRYKKNEKKDPYKIWGFGSYASTNNCSNSNSIL